MESRFTTTSNEDDVQIMKQIKSLLPKEIMKNVDESKSKKIVKDGNQIEFILSDLSGKAIASASISEFSQGVYYWSVYKEC